MYLNCLFCALPVEDLRTSEHIYFTHQIESHQDEHCNNSCPGHCGMLYNLFLSILTIPDSYDAKNTENQTPLSPFA